ncbi:MAG: hypothetical protein V3T22_12355 [Planctomycetota bacterium]
MSTESRDQLLDRRLEQIRRGASEAIRREVEWLKRHNFPVWVWKNGHVVDATKNGGAEKSQD